MNSELEKIVVCLERVSLEQQAGPDRAGLERQRECNRRTVAHHNLKSLDSVVLKNVSGTAVRRAPEIQKILGMIERRQIGGVVVADLDRLARTVRFEDFALLQTFQDTGAVIYTGDAVLRPSSADGFFSSVMKMAWTGMELQGIRKRMMGGKEELRKKGLCASAAHTLPLGIGYDRATKKFIVSPEIEMVKEAFRLVDECGIKNYCEISRRTGIKATSLKNLLRNTFFKGIRTYDTKRGSEKYASINGRQAERKKVRRAPEEIIRVKVFDDPPVDPARFDRVQKVLDETNRRWKDIRSHKPQVTFLAQGIAFCDLCGSPLYGSAHPRRNGVVLSYYRCRSNTPRHRQRTGGCAFAHQRRAAVDEALRQLISDEFSRPGVIRRLIEHVLESRRLSIGAGHSADEIEATLGRLDRRRERLLDGFEAGHVTLIDLEKRLAKIEAQKSAAEALLVQSQRPDDRDIARTAKLIARGALAFRRISDVSAQKIIANQLLSKVMFRGDKIVSFSLRPQFQDLVLRPI